MKKLLKTLLAVFIWLCVWQTAAMLVGKSVLLPTVSQTLKAVFSLCTDAQAWISVGVSVARVLAGLLLGTVAGCLLGTVCAFFAFAQTLFSPLVSVIRATPVASFIILAFVWIEPAYVPVFTAFLIVTPIFHTSIYASLKSTDKGLIEMAGVFRMSAAAKLRHIYIPLSFNSFRAALVTCMGMAWKASVAAEVICRNRLSIGGNLYEAKTTLETADVFAWTVIVIALSTAFEKAAVLLLKKIGKGSVANG